jgi:hypothetical protein
MTFDEFRQSLAGAAPPRGADLALEGQWWAGKGDWERAHNCVQQLEGKPDCDLVHAHLHRIEGDLANAGDWYRSADEKAATGAIEAEWEAIARRFLERAP